MIVGIDPGKTGGIAILDHRKKFVAGLRTPTLKHGKRDVVDTRGLTDWTRHHVGRGVIEAIVIEQVGAMPGQGVTSMFNFGRHTGAVEGWAIGKGCPVHWVTPSVWKGKIGIRASKDAALNRCSLEFGASPLWGVKANDGIAEAALIALYWLKHG